MMKRSRDDRPSGIFWIIDKIEMSELPQNKLK